MIEKLLTARELADILGLSADAVLDRFEQGALPGFRLFKSTDKLGRPTGAVRFRWSEVAVWLEEQRPERDAA